MTNLKYIFIGACMWQPWACTTQISLRERTCCKSSSDQIALCCPAIRIYHGVEANASLGCSRPTASLAGALESAMKNSTNAQSLPLDLTPALFRIPHSCAIVQVFSLHPFHPSISSIPYVKTALSLGSPLPIPVPSLLYPSETFIPKNFLYH